MTTLARRLSRDARGAVMLEFLVAFVPVLTLFLGTVQLLLIASADLVVRHAAITGVRAAIVVLADAPRFYGDEVTRSIAKNGPRLAAIRDAVSVPLAALAPEPKALLALLSGSSTMLADELGDAPVSRFAVALAVYDRLSTVVTFPVLPAKDELHKARLPESDSTTLRVTYLFYCGVPLAAALMCSTYSQLEGDRKLRELEQTPKGPLRTALRLSSARFSVMRGEATLPSQYAEYVERQTEAAGEP